MTSRQERMMREEGMRLDKIEQLTNRYLNDLKQEEVTLAEAKVVTRRMAHIVNHSGRYGLQTPLSDIPLRD